jgi:hypothetical protein
LVVVVKLHVALPAKYGEWRRDPGHLARRLDMAEVANDKAWTPASARTMWRGSSWRALARGACGPAASRAGGPAREPGASWRVLARKMQDSWLRFPQTGSMLEQVDVVDPFEELTEENFVK